ncbi:DUF4412 domain-containing protein [bacterium]|nr:DUF4412 domain-containing protein [bacterium]
MRKFLFVLAVFFVCSSLLAADIWETREEIDVNGAIAEKSMFVSDSVMKVVNTSPNGDTETLIDLNADKITIINHKYKSFQTIKLSKYIEFAQQLFSELKDKTGKFDPDKVIPKVAFEKQGNETVEKWNCEVWAVSVDGKLYSQVWVAPSLKSQQMIDFRKKFASALPENLSKYRTVDAQIDDKFAEIGTVVRSLKVAQNPKMPAVKITVKKMMKSDLKKIDLVIPAGYVDKSAPEMTNTQTKQ